MSSNRKRDALRRDWWYSLTDAILQRIDIPSSVREDAIARALNEEILEFSAHCNGHPGATIGFALIELTRDADSLDELSAAFLTDVMDLADDHGLALDGVSVLASDE